MEIPVAVFTVPTFVHVLPASTVRRTRPPSHNTFARSFESVARSWIRPVAHAFAVALPSRSRVVIAVGSTAQAGAVLVTLASRSVSSTVAGLQEASSPVSTGLPASLMAADETERRGTRGPFAQFAPAFWLRVITTEPSQFEPVTTRHADSALMGTTMTRSACAAGAFELVVDEVTDVDVDGDGSSLAVRSPGRIAQATSATSRISSSPRANGHRLRRTGCPFDQVEFLGQYAAFAALVTQFPYLMAAGASRTDR